MDPRKLFSGVAPRCNGGNGENTYESYSYSIKKVAYLNYLKLRSRFGSTTLNVYDGDPSATSNGVLSVNLVSVLLLV
jgi:hypothetical protein